MHHIPATIIGAGQAGLAMSHCLAQRGVQHVVLERGRIGERWRSERWDSLRLLSPNWMSRLPGWIYRGDDPDGFMTAAMFADHLAAYAKASHAPVEASTEVLSVRTVPFGYQVETSRGVWRTRAVVIATGDCDVPWRPALAQRLPLWIHQITPSEYRNPEQLPDGGVLVVGASATGLQLAEELCRAGRTVVLSAGRQSRLPRRYRGRDIWWWLERTGMLNELTTDVPDLRDARTRPSFQLIGGANTRTIDLGTLHAQGVRILGRTIGIDETTLRLSDDLAETTAAAQRALEHLLARVDAVADAAGAPPRDADAARGFKLPSPPATFDLKAEGIRTVLWATGYRRNYAWLKVPVLDAAGEIMHEGGVTPSAGLYVLGLRFLRRRRSHFIDGVGLDAEELADTLVGHLVQPTRVAA
jgi:putative flavoprotein involved in K+ transport